VRISVVEGDLLSQDVEVIVNSWNRNIIPWWLLLPQGVSGAIKRRAGTGPFRELAKKGAIPLGGAVVTGAGSLGYRAIIHVAAISMLWRSSELAIRDGTRNALSIAKAEGWSSIAFPVLGSGTGGFNLDQAIALMSDEIAKHDYIGSVTIVRFNGNAAQN